MFRRSLGRCRSLCLLLHLLVSCSLIRLVTWFVAPPTAWSLGHLVSCSLIRLVTWFVAPPTAWSLGHLVSCSLIRLVAWFAARPTPVTLRRVDGRAGSAVPARSTGGRHSAARSAARRRRRRLGGRCVDRNSLRRRAAPGCDGDQGTLLPGGWLRCR